MRLQKYMPKTMIRSKIKYYHIKTFKFMSDANDFANELKPIYQKKIIRVENINGHPNYGVYSPTKSVSEV